MKASRIPTTGVGLKLMIVFALFLTSASAEATLQIQKAVCGAYGSWDDVTAFLQSKVHGDTLSVKITQPFREIGGDPAPGQVKNLIIDYRLNGVSSQLALKEQYPVAFTIKLPSSGAVAPGTDAETAVVMADAMPHVHRRHSGQFWFGYLGYSIALIALIWAIIATLQWWKLKKQLGMRT